MLLSRIILSLRSGANLTGIVGRRWISSGSTSTIDSGSSSSSSTSDSDSSGSENEEQFSPKEEDTRALILKAALEFVPAYGWSTKALAAGAEKAGFPSTTHGMFNRGGADLVHYFTKTSNEALAERLASDAELASKEPERKKGTGRIVRDAVELRLRMLIPYINKWPQAMALMALPQNAPEAIRASWTLVDDIWYFAGDRSTDFNYYTKRTTLGLVYGNTELYMVQDSSEDFQKTWKFLDRRLENLAQFGKTIRQCQEGSETLGNLTCSAFHIARNVLTLNEQRR